MVNNLVRGVIISISLNAVFVHKQTTEGDIKTATADLIGKL